MAGQRLDLTQHPPFGQLTALERVDGPGPTKWRCRCTCGRVVEVKLGNLRSGHSTACMACGRAKNDKHGQSRTDKAFACLSPREANAVRLAAKTAGKSISDLIRDALIAAGVLSE